MNDYSEIDALKAINDALGQLGSGEERRRVLTWAVDKFGEGEVRAPTESSPPADPTNEDRSPTKERKGKEKARKSKSTTKRKAGGKTAPTISKDLNLRPGDKEAFVDFSKRLSPSNNNEKTTVAVYYLRHVLGRDPVGVNDIFTCFKRAGWRVPADIRNALSLNASRKGWLDTSDMENLYVTPAGQNLVEHDLETSE